MAFKDYVQAKPRKLNPINKSTLTVYVQTHILNQVRTLNVNVSALVNELLAKYLDNYYEQEDKEGESLEKEIVELKTKLADAEVRKTFKEIEKQRNEEKIKKENEEIVSFETD